MKQFRILVAQLPDQAPAIPLHNGRTPFFGRNRAVAARSPESHGSPQLPNVAHGFASGYAPNHIHGFRPSPTGRASR